MAYRSSAVLETGRLLRRARTGIVGERSRRSRPVSRVLSRTTIHLGRASPRASSDLPESGAGNAVGFLFGLAPSGVYPAVRITTNAVRSYRTISPLPATSRGWEAGGIFSVALSVGSRRPEVIWHPALWSPDFPPPCTANPPMGGPQTL